MSSLQYRVLKMAKNTRKVGKKNPNNRLVQVVNESKDGSSGSNPLYSLVGNHSPPLQDTLDTKRQCTGDDTDEDLTMEVLEA